MFSIALNAVAALPPPPQNGTGQPFFWGDTSAADPASIGMAVLLANWTNQLGEDYASAATAQVEYLFGPLVPKTSDGAISHRVSQLQLWYVRLSLAVVGWVLIALGAILFPWCPHFSRIMA